MWKRLTSCSLNASPSLVEQFCVIPWLSCGKWNVGRSDVCHTPPGLAQKIPNSWILYGLFPSLTIVEDGKPTPWKAHGSEICHGEEYLTYQKFCHFFIGWLVFLLLSFESCLYILVVSPLSGIWFANISSQSLLVFWFSILILVVKWFSKSRFFFNLMKSNYQCIIYRSHFDIVYKESLSNPRQMFF